MSEFFAPFTLLDAFIILQNLFLSRRFRVKLLRTLSSSLVRARLRAKRAPSGPTEEQLALRPFALTVSPRVRVPPEGNSLSLLSRTSRTIASLPNSRAISPRLSSSISSSPAARSTTGAPSAAPSLDQRRERLPQPWLKKARIRVGRSTEFHPQNCPTRDATENDGKTTAVQGGQDERETDDSHSAGVLENASSRWWSSAQKRLTLTASPTRKSATH